MNDSAPIFHHYAFSNFSEKIRLVFGLKEIDWYSVTIPSTSPKPLYEPLTGGYRRTPALQIGADVLCDTRLIAEFLEKRVPEPTLFPGADPAHSEAWTWTLGYWAESQFLWPLARYITAHHADRFPPSFHEDRARLHGKPVGDLARVKASAAKNLAQLEPQLAWLEALLPEAGFLLGDAPGLADFTVYHPLFLLECISGERPPGLLHGCPKTRAWMARVAAIGNGRALPCDAKAALDRATGASPTIDSGPVAENPLGLASGALVSVTPSDDHSSASFGRLASLSERRIAIDRDDPELRHVRVHFPRVDYRVRLAPAPEGGADG